MSLTLTDRRGASSGEQYRALLEVSEAIAVHRDLPQLAPQLHLPVQSGSDRILAAMNRRHTRTDYLRVIERLRAARPDLALTSDFIVGFPGETEEDFRDTLRLVEEVSYSGAFSFKYSPRPGTPGADMPDHVPEEVKAERLERLQALLFRQQTEFQQSMAGREFEVLVEKPGRFEHQMVGRSPWLLPVIIEMKADDNLEIGDIIKVRITKAGTNSLHAERA